MQEKALQLLPKVNARASMKKNICGRRFGKMHIPGAAKRFLCNALNSVPLEDALCPIYCREEERPFNMCFGAGSDVWAERQSALQKWSCENVDFFPAMGHVAAEF